jgi:peptidoglycan/xylan/chitin deacetylase (PgdA/CDA1 family)
MFACVTICLTIPDRRLRPLARYGLEEAFLRVGLPFWITDDEPTQGAVVYGPAPPSWRGATLQYDKRCYDPAVRFAAVGCPPLWAPEGAKAEDVDLVGGLARLLTLADESQIDEKSRNRLGIFKVAALPEARGRVRAEPLAEHHAAALGRQFEIFAPELPKPRCLWPAGHRYAVLVTHDTDAVALRAPLEILFNGAKAVVRRNRLRARMAWDGLVLKGDDPLFGFERWAEAEKALGVRSAFFVSGRGHVRPSIHDCRSTVFDRNVDWDSLRRLADHGWEFAYHPPIRAKDDVRELMWGKRTLEARLGNPVHGLRHHYWALDWRRPYLTFRKHIDAGFGYDSSIALRDAAGFRAGTCLPYRPFDPECGRALDFYEIPATIMDRHVISDNGDVEAAVRAVLCVVEKVRQVGGVLVLDWHTEAAVESYCFRNFRTTLMQVLAALLLDTEAWFVTPWQLTSHWDERRRSLCLEAAGRSGRMRVSP